MQKRAWFVGEGSLVTRCADVWLLAGHLIDGVVSDDPGFTEWAHRHTLTVVPRSGAFADTLRQSPFDYLFSVGNMHMLAEGVIKAPRSLAINFHYGPLPEYAGVHVPVWALLDGRTEYGITWHEMTSGVDAGRIAVSDRFAIADDETAMGLAALSFEAGARTFATLVEDITHDRLALTPQDVSARRVYRRHERPAGHGVVDWTKPAALILRLLRALDFGRLENTFGTARMLTADRAFIATHDASLSESAASAAPGTLLAVSASAIVVATGSTPIELRGFRRLTGEAISVSDLVAECGLVTGLRLPVLSADQARSLEPVMAAAVRDEATWIDSIGDVSPVVLPHADPGALGGGERTVLEVTLAAPLGTGVPGLDESTPLLAALTAFVARSAGTARLPLAIGPEPSGPARALLAGVVPCVVDVGRSWGDHVSDIARQLERARSRGPILLDVAARYPAVPGLAALDRWRRAVVVGDPQRPASHAPADLVLTPSSKGDGVTIDAASAVYSSGALERLRDELTTFVNHLTDDAVRLDAVPLMSEAERRRILIEWNRTDRPVPPLTVHESFEAQVARTPEATAVAFRDRTLTYRQLNQHANHLARTLRQAGVGPESVVGLFLDRSLEMVVALFGILKAGGAYLPLDPAFPQERLAWMLEDTAATVIVTTADLADARPPHQAQVIAVDLAATPPADLPNVHSGVAPEHLAYVIFTSGSTGRPKGVMVEHRQAVNFFVGMDEYLGGRAPGTWLAVTSISFDISVLELFWTLARGYMVVVQEELVKAAGSAAAQAADERGMDFSLFYFSADARGDGGNRYRLLLDGAKYADAHGFKAVWTPERHFHEFGGLYPNPSVTSAAIAAVTSRVRIRAGSVVLPLHNPIRVAEEWAVVDHLSQGRVELSFASGWHANDFALMPQNYADRRDVMLAGIETIRALWRGEAVPATNGHGEPIAVKVFPPPLQEKPPFWIAAAGNIDTFKVAGRIGANLLTNLLGQSAAEVATKVAAYRAARREAGHAGEGLVALMLHTFVGPDLDQVRATVKQPLIDYLKTATELVKKTRWEFPAFANPSGKQAQTGEVDLSADDVDAMMEHAFERYFQTSGLFGTPDMCLARVQELKAIGIDEIACLLDFGIATDTVFDHLRYLNEVRRRSQPAPSAHGDFTIAKQIVRHDVTHLQGTPSLMRTILADGHGRAALATVRTILVGGEPLPSALATELLTLVRGELLNMYGPTETTVWSTVARIADGADVTIGRPIANTEIYITDPSGLPVPVGAVGELLIGGLGVTRGYWRREALTAERFVANRARPERGDRLYRTGDLARYRADGRIECLGRVDHQVKLSGHRIELGEIEMALDAHASVGQSVVVARPDATGEPRLVAYVVPKTSAASSSGGDLSRWQAVWDETYGLNDQTLPTADATFDLSGWRSSYTGEQAPASEMREWVSATVERILALRPARVFEIGCGTGLLLHAIAPSVERYAAIDFSPTVVARLEESVGRHGWRHVTVRAAAADTLSAQTDLWPADVVVINSVAQYFPDVDYFVRVLEQAVAAVRPGGAVFVGDVRSLPLLEAFHTSVELAQAPAGLATTELRDRIRERVQQDPELVIAPAFFEAFRARVPAVTSVDIQIKRGRAHNEMTRFRYDVVCSIGGSVPPAVPAEVDGRSFGRGDVVSALRTATDGVTIRDLVNPRLAQALATVRALSSEAAPETVAALRHQLGPDTAPGIEPEDLVAAAPGWRVDLRWATSGDLAAYDATVTRPGAPSGVTGARERDTGRPWREFVHQAADRGQLAQVLKRHLRSRLPAYMVPSAIAVLDALPLTPNGKIDRQALPEPDRQRQQTASTYVAPASEIERVVAETWQELLALDRVGTHDNFFDLGANSLLMVQAHAALKARVGRPLGLVDLFRFPTVSALAGFLSQTDEAKPSAALSAADARAQARKDALGRRRAGAGVVRS